MKPTPTELAMVQTDIQRAIDLAMKPIKPPPGHYATAELEDEDDPDSIVVIRSTTGEATAWMSREAYEAVRARKVSE